MAVSIQDVLRIAALARLRLDPAEADRFTGQLNAILGHFDELRAVAGADAGLPLVLTDRAGEPRADGGDPDPLARPVSETAVAWMDGFFTVPRLAAMEGIDDEGAS
jgi:aspartyl-tRNA(Asn)/glutamyl-tRNA(Gln) amidotransferase subunit C